MKKKSRWQKWMGERCGMAVWEGEGGRRMLRLGTTLALRFARNECTLVSGWMACGSCENRFLSLPLPFLYIRLSFLASTARATSRCTYWLSWPRFCKSIVRCNAGLLSSSIIMMTFQFLGTRFVLWEIIALVQIGPKSYCLHRLSVSGRAKCMIW